MNFTWSVIVPLIGGLPLAMKNVFEKDPEYIMSYSPFQNNDKHFVSYLRQQGWNGKYHVLDSIEDSCIADICTDEPETNVDVVGAVCPCAGLSSLSVTSNADSAVNQWLYTSAEYVLKNRKPKIFWGENAPRLATASGKKVADELYEIGKKYGYHFLIYSTESRLHGNPQIRPRTFYFFFNKEHFASMPVLFDIPKETLSYEVILAKPLIENDPMNILMNPNVPSKDPYYSFLYEHLKAESHRDLIEKLCPSTDGDNKSANLLVYSIDYVDKNHGGLDYLIDWFKDNGFERASKRMSDVKAKREDNKGAWLHGTTVARDIIPSFVAHMPSSLIHPYEDRYLYIREGLRLMKMPDDFMLANENPLRDLNHICQNVIVTTAELMCKEIVLMLTGNSPVTDGSYAIQTNKGGTTVICDRTPTDDLSISSLDDFC